MRKRCFFVALACLLAVVPTLPAPASPTWEVTATVNELALGLGFRDKTTGLSAGAKNLVGPRILKTTDGGSTWQSKLNSNPNVALVDVVWQDQDTAYASGDGAQFIFNQGNSILKSTDQGESWFGVWNKSWFSYWTEMQVLRPNYIIATGQWTPFLYTKFGITTSTDGGESWTERMWNWNYTAPGGTGGDTTGVGAWPTALDFLDENHGFLAGGIWPWNSAQSLLGLPLDSNHVPKGPGGGNQWQAIAEKTTDGGNTWTTIFQQDGFTLHDIDFINQNEGWVTGYYQSLNGQMQGWLYHTTDGGLTWQQQIYGQENGSPIMLIHMFNRREGWIAGYRNNEPTQRTLIYHTTDGGQTWVEMDFHPFADSFDMFFFNESEGWIVGPNSAQQSKYLHYIDPSRTPKLNLAIPSHPDTVRPGDSLSWTVAVQNVSGQTQQGDVWVYLASPALGSRSPYPVLLARNVTFLANLNTTRTLSLRLPQTVPAGLYNVETIIGPYANPDPLQHLAYASFDVQVVTGQ